jgi:hypothetical protein
VRSRREWALALLDEAHGMMVRNVENVSLAEALFVPPGGYRSILGTLKHAAGWSHVYRSYAFDAAPRHWREIDWPWGLRDTVVESEEYLAAVIEWFHASHRDWVRDVQALDEEELDGLRPLHWGERKPLFDIVVIISGHNFYHAGELNQVLSIARGEAWEEGEEVEENHVSTVGHRVRPPWLQ